MSKCIRAANEDVTLMKTIANLAKLGDGLGESNVMVGDTQNKWVDLL